MTKPGPKPTPTAVKQLRGTARPDRVSVNEPRPQGEARMPRGVLSPEARKVWARLAPELKRLGLLTSLDGLMFMLLCAWAGVAVEAAREIRASGIIDEDERGRESKNRALTVLRAASVELRQLSSCFGLTPADRARLAGSVQPEEPTLAEQLFTMVHGGEDG